MSSVPLDSIDGTHNPTKIPSSRCPVNHNRIEKMKEINAAKLQARTAFLYETIRFTFSSKHRLG